MIGILIASGAILLAVTIGWLLYAFVIDPDMLNRVSRTTIQYVVAAGVTGLLLATLPPVFTREPSAIPESHDIYVESVSETCEVLWVQFLESDSQLEFKLWSVWDRFCRDVPPAFVTEALAVSDAPQ